MTFIASGSDVSVVVGKPGTGKTYMLKALNTLYSESGYELIGGAIASKAAKGLELESGIKSSTLASINFRLNNGSLKLTSKSIVVVDEAGMVDFATTQHFNHSTLRKQRSAKR